MIVSDHQSTRTGEYRAAEHFATGNQCRVDRSQRDQVSAKRMVLSVEVNAVKRFLERILVERRTKVIRDFVGPIELNLFAERNEGIREFAFEDAHVSRSGELR